MPHRILPGIVLERIASARGEIHQRNRKGHRRLSPVRLLGGSLLVWGAVMADTEDIQASAEPSTAASIEASPPIADPFSSAAADETVPQPSETVTQTPAVPVALANLTAPPIVDPLSLSLGSSPLVPPAKTAGISPAAAGTLPEVERSASESELPRRSLAALIGGLPPDARYIGPALRDVFQAFEAGLEVQRKIRQQRAEQDAVRTKLAVINGELEVESRHRQQAEARLSALEQQQQGRLEAVRKEFESRLEHELGQARQQVAEELGAEFARRAQAFEARQREAIERGFSQQWDLEERELEQLSQDVGIQMKEFLGRLSQLELSPEVLQAIEGSTNDALAKRKTAFETRRGQLDAEREALMEKQRGEFLATLKEQQRVEEQRRLTLKEAGLRQAMAELLYKARLDEGEHLEEARKVLTEIRARESQLTQEQAVFADRLASSGSALEGTLRRMDVLEAERQAVLAQFEAVLQKPQPVLREAALSWLNSVIPQMPSELATELGVLQQRVATLARRDEALQEQHRVVRERQLALQVAHEMESRYQESLVKQQSEQQAKARRVEELLGKAEQLGSRGRFDEALRIVAEAQVLNPPTLSRVVMLREQLMASKERAERRVEMEEIERLFAQAMEVFEQGRYDEAIPLFEQVIAQEATLDEAVQVAEGEQAAR